MTFPPNLKELYDRDGYIVVSDAINEDQLQALDLACERVIHRTRSGDWSQRRTVGKQFPPFDTVSQRPDVWGVQHIMHPDLNEPVFAQLYADDGLCDVAKILLQCSDEDLQMELFNILINPEEHDFALRWHRDDVRETATAEEEEEALGKWHHGVQWNTALFEDDALFVVPGSHLKPRTPEQRVQSCTMDPPADPMTMPGAKQVVLKRGETVFYNNNILHCATYSRTKKRATLHGCMGDARGGAARARNILQHNLKWMRDECFRSSLNERARMMLDKLIVMDNAARAIHGDEVLYSLNG